MSSAVSALWHDRAMGFFSSSGGRLKEAGKNAGAFVGEVAKDAKGNWVLLQQPSVRHAVQERLIETAASIGSFLRKGISGTKDKVVVGKTKVEEVAKKIARISKSIITDMERWQKGFSNSDAFGVPIEITVQQQQSSRPVPNILIKCADYLISTGLDSQSLFKSEGDKEVIQQLIMKYNEDPDASLPNDTNPLDVAILAKCYLASLPEPLTTFDLYEELKGARSSVQATRSILERLPSANYMTLEYITALLLRISHNSHLNKMDARSLAIEMAPVLMWQKGRNPEFYREYWNKLSGSPPKNVDPAAAISAWDMLVEQGETDDPAATVEVVQNLIEHHNAVFIDANVTTLISFILFRLVQLFEHFTLPSPSLLAICTGIATACGGDRFGYSSLLAIAPEATSSISCPPSLLATAPEPPAHRAAIDLALLISAASVFSCVVGESSIPPTVAPPLVSFFLWCNLRSAMRLPV
ncbi:hypothetical protein NL676_016289 [Syzygium grande]|nr:hypothetical protein NL676_016289 [Syzygium grande]